MTMKLRTSTAILLLSGSMVILVSLIALGALPHSTKGRSQEEVEVAKIQALMKLQKDCSYKTKEYKAIVKSRPMPDPDYMKTKLGESAYGMVQSSAEAISKLEDADHAIFGLAGFYDKSVEVYQKRLNEFKNIKDQ